MLSRVIAKNIGDVFLRHSVVIFLRWYFIPKVLKLANVKMYVRNDYDGDSETVNVLARHTASSLLLSQFNKLQ